MKCKNCKNYDRRSEWCERICDAPDTEVERECEFYIRMTNADRIRNMTDEELLDIIFGSCLGNIEYAGQEGCGDVEEECNKCILRWLQKEVAE